ncbi:FecR domain-containing protein [Phaeobacter marinintestinus]|uniref:FecR domain-containing protein n=1 Tax=Falsiphaeobacter marinintestinus TaxID=1492905 RepID=UPI001644C727|nr:FecR family protein [Phaeobacter marinintestinus]
MPRFLSVLLVSLFCSTALMAQVPANCAITERRSPPRQVLECPGGLIVDIEAAAQLGLISGDQGNIARITLQSGAVFVEVDPDGSKPIIETPHAIAAVRGTVYVVDAQADRTSVFVQRGVVKVSNRSSSSTVTLRAGQGVDVTPGAAMESKTWGASRVDALLARFGR